MVARQVSVSERVKKQKKLLRGKAFDRLINSPRFLLAALNNRIKIQVYMTLCIIPFFSDTITFTNTSEYQICTNLNIKTNSDFLY